MKLLIIRHGDPDYARDSLTERGWREAELLADRLEKLDIAAFYVSPLGRAQATASRTLERLGRKGETLDWLREFPVRRWDPEAGRDRVIWDWLPEQWTPVPEYYDLDAWTEAPVMVKAGAGAVYREVCAGLDALLARHGYRRNGRAYDALKPSRDAVALFCHFGVECVLLSRLLGLSPMVLWHGTIALTSSVTTLATEERHEGKALFRMSAFGDVSHLCAAGVEPSFSGRFCETFDCAEERHV